MNDIFFYLLLIGVTIFNVALNVIKKIVMNKIGAVQATSITWWFNFFLNPYIIAILLTTLILFALNMWLLSLMTVNKLTAWGWALGLGAFILTLIMTKVFLGELFEFNLGFVMIIISMIIGIIGAYLW